MLRDHIECLYLLCVCVPVCFCLCVHVCLSVWWQKSYLSVGLFLSYNSSQITIKFKNLDRECFTEHICRMRQRIYSLMTDVMHTGYPFAPLLGFSIWGCRLNSYNSYGFHCFMEFDLAHQVWLQRAMQNCVHNKFNLIIN